MAAGFLLDVCRDSHGCSVTLECVISHMNESRHTCNKMPACVTYEWVTSHMQRHGCSRCTCGMTQSHVIWLIRAWQSSHACVAWLSHMWYDSFMHNRAAMRVAMHGVTNSYMIWMSHITHEGVILHRNESRHRGESPRQTRVLMGRSCSVPVGSKVVILLIR